MRRSTPGRTWRRSGSRWPLGHHPVQDRDARHGRHVGTDRPHLGPERHRAPARHDGRRRHVRPAVRLRRCCASPRRRRTSASRSNSRSSPAAQSIDAVDDVQLHDLGPVYQRLCPSTVHFVLASPTRRSSPTDGDAYLLPNDTSLSGVWADARRARSRRGATRPTRGSTARPRPARSFTSRATLDER